jgi:hypothetical protein
MKTILERIRTALSELRQPEKVPSYSPRSLTRRSLSALLEATIETAEEELAHWWLMLATKTIDRF